MTTTKLVEKMVEVHFVLGNIEYVTRLSDLRIRRMETLEIAFLDRPPQAFKIRDVNMNGSVHLELDQVPHLDSFGSTCSLARRVN